jgi:Lon protease-like protein
MRPLDRYRTPADLPRRIPVFPLPGALLLPRAGLPLNIFEPRYLRMVGDAMSGERIIGMVQPAGSAAAGMLADAGARPPIYPIGCAGRITSYAETADGRFLIELTGICRFLVVSEPDCPTPYRQVDADFASFASDLTTGQGEDQVNRCALIDTFRAYLEARQPTADWSEVEAASTECLVNSLSVISPYPPEDKQALLEAPDLRSRAELLIALTEIALSRQCGAAEPRLQ